LYVDVGTAGSKSDGGVFNRSWLGQKILSGNLNLPHPCNLPGERFS
jgi:hypothetical protein